jgi:hypothetical protein
MVFRERFKLRKINDLEVRKQYQIEITNMFAALENLDNDGDINKVHLDHATKAQRGSRGTAVLNLGAVWG